jgi:hypothetical protein
MVVITVALSIIVEKGLDKLFGKKTKRKGRK